MARSPMPSIRAAITRFDLAAQNYAFRGSYEPADREEVEDEYRRAREVLEARIERTLNDAR